jgi:hypothetical protein
MSTATETNQVYLSAIARLQIILESPKATPDQKDEAQDALDALTLLHGSYAIQEVQGRTALLSGLIVELQEVIDSINVNPFGDAAEKLNGILTSAKGLYDKGKEALGGK